MRTSERPSPVPNPRHQRLAQDQTCTFCRLICWSTPQFNSTVWAPKLLQQSWSQPIAQLLIRCQATSC